MDEQEAAIGRRFESGLLARVRALVTPELVAEHRRNPIGIHSAELDFVLGVVRRHASPDMDRLLIFATDGDGLEGERFRVLEHSTRVPGGPMGLRGPSSDSIEEITHRIFLERLVSLGFEIPEEGEA